MDRRSEVINEALAAEIQRGEQRKETSSRVTTAINLQHQRHTD